MMADDFSMEIRALLKQITPQKSGEVDELTNGVTFRQDNTAERIGFAANTKWKLVRVTMRCQSRLWAHCYAYYCAFTDFDARRSGLESELSSEQLKVAGDLLEWAVTTDIAIRIHGGSATPATVSYAPVDAPLPFDGASADVVKGCAEMIFLHALAFILHHELAHIHLGHGVADGSLAVQQEFDADAAAARWILGAPIEDEFYYLVRHLGVAIALIWFTSLDFREPHVQHNHPPSWKRLLAALKPTVRGDEDAIWGFVVLALTLHFRRYGISLDILLEVSPTQSTVVEMIDTIEKFNAELGA